MAAPSAAANTCAITINIYDGSRQPAPDSLDILITLQDTRQKQVYRDFTRGFTRTIQNLPYYNIGDTYTALSWAPGYKQAGFTPVKVSPAAPASLDVMLLGNNATFNFHAARWDVLRATHPQFTGLLSADLADGSAAADRYSQLMEDQPAVLACFFNLATAIAQLPPAAGNPLGLFRELIWDRMQQDRFFAWADHALVDRVREAAAKGIFSPELNPGAFHPGATSSYKQTQFGEANIQLTFHENDRKTIGGVECVMVEPDMDYYKDLLAHALLEVATHAIIGSLSDPRQVYVLRWIAARHAGVAEFDPPYVLA
jgi:hypothetical protein